MATLKLKSEKREPHGKGAARRLRSAGRVPGVLYGRGEGTQAVTFDEHEFDALLRAREGTVIVEMNVGGTGAQPTLIREIQREPVTGKVLHVDFLHLSLAEKVHVEVPVHVVGTPFGVKTEGGILEHHMRHIEVNCLPGDIPSRVDIDVTELTIGKSLHVSSLVMDDKVELLTDPRAVLVSVAAPRVVEEPVAEEEAEVEGAEPAVEGAEPAAEGAGDKESE